MLSLEENNEHRNTHTHTQAGASLLLPDGYDILLLQEHVNESSIGISRGDGGGRICC